MQESSTALMDAARGGYVDIVRLLLEQRVDVNAQMTVRHGDSG